MPVSPCGKPVSDGRLPAYRGVPASLAQRLAQVPGVASAVGETGFPNGTVRTGDVDLVAVTAKPGVSPDVLASRVRAALDSATLEGGQGYTIATGAARGDLANLDAGVERAYGQAVGLALIIPVTLMVVTLHEKSAAGQLALAFPLLLACVLSVALLGPLLVAFAGWLARPACGVGGAPARLALAAIAAQPRRAASAVIPVAMAVAMVGTIYFANTGLMRGPSLLGKYSPWE